MKHKTKKILALSLATIMTSGLFVVAAVGCGDDNDNDPNKGTGTVQGSTKESTALLNSMLAQEFAALSADVNADITNTQERYEYNNGTKGKKTDSESYTMNMVETTKLNLKDMNADITVKMTADKEVEEWTYAFLRNFHSFDYDARESGEVKNWNSNITLNYGGYAFDEMELDNPMLEGLLGDSMGDAFGEAYSTEMKVCTYTLTKLADSFSALKIEKDKATIDVNAMAYGMATQITAVLNKLNDNTTVGDLLKEPAIKNILMSITELFPVTDVKAAIDEVVKSLPDEVKGMLTAMQIDLSKIFVAPDKNSTTYDYILKILGSQELLNAVNKALQQAIPSDSAMSGAPVGLTETFDKMKISTILQMTGAPIKVTDLKDFVTPYLQGITKTNFTLNDGESDTFTLSDASIVYTLSGNKVTKQDISAKFSMLSTSYGNGSSSGSYISEYTTAGTATATIEYSATEYTLADISNCKTQQSAHQYENNATLDSWSLRNYGYTAKQNVVNNKVVSITLTDSKGASQTVSDGDYFTLVLNGESVEANLEMPYSSYASIYVEGEYFTSLSLESTYGYYMSTVKNVLSGNKGTFVPGTNN
ncbi:MAG: hypothetical protein K2L87_02440 [Clostridiales bacterium]|nr:hypothetical protein [Clostridiales bacterium]